MIQEGHIHQQPEWFNQRLPDGGPVYAETDLDRFVVEPWNALSSLLIVVPAIIWFFKIRKDSKHFKFMLLIIPLMILGGSGSTLFHAFRVSRFFLIMDVLPTAILTLSLTIYFWQKIVGKWYYVLAIVVFSMAARFLLFGSGWVDEFLAINLSYVLTGFLIGLPLLLLLIKTNRLGMFPILAAIMLFLAAIFFREFDTREISFLPMGTHFLWHIFTGVGAWFVLDYLYRYRNWELQ